MPIYGYKCDQCGHEVEVLQSMSDQPLKVCPNCMGPLRKMIYPAGIIFKGSGYYTTDYKSQGKSSANGETSSGSSAETTTASEKKADSTDSSKPSKPAKPATKEGVS
jgi:putative FmdB family regulatory protein